MKQYVSMDVDLQKAKSQSTKLWKKRIRKFVNNKLAMLGLIIIAIFLFCILAAPIITPYDPQKPDFGSKLEGPSREHIFGTDSMGRDLFTRIVYGGQTSILIAVSSALLGSCLGVLLGAIGGYFGGILDWILIRISEIFMSFPQMLLVMIVMAFTGPGVFNLIIIFMFTGWTGAFRLVRAEYIARREETYIKVCEAFGMSKTAIMFKQILPSVLNTVIVQFTMNIPSYVISEAGLSFLGFGVPMSTPTWGTMLNAAKSIKIILYNPNVWIVPGIAICLFVLAVNFFGDGLRDVLDPRQK